MFQRLVEKDITLEVSDKFKDRLVDEGFNPAYGARPLRRAIMRLLEDVLAEEILSGRLQEGDTATVDIDAENKVAIVPKKETVELLPSS